MPKCVLPLFAVLLVLTTSASAKSSGSHGGSHSSHGSRSYSSHSRSYSHARSGSTHRASKPHTSHRASSTASHSHGYRRNYAVPGYTLHSSVQRDSHSRIKRSSAAKNDFKRQQPCPSTGRRSGSCPGYVIDHRRALECGGADAPSNMHWQTTAAAKAKDRTERYCR
jgi:hypothetical protein